MTATFHPQISTGEGLGGSPRGVGKSVGALHTRPPKHYIPPNITVYRPTGNRDCWLVPSYRPVGGGDDGTVGLGHGLELHKTPDVQLFHSNRQLRRRAPPGGAVGAPSGDGLPAPPNIAANAPRTARNVMLCNRLTEQLLPDIAARHRRLAGPDSANSGLASARPAAARGAGRKGGRRAGGRGPKASSTVAGVDGGSAASWANGASGSEAAAASTRALTFLQPQRPVAAGWGH